MLSELVSVPVFFSFFALIDSCVIVVLLLVIYHHLTVLRTFNVVSGIGMRAAVIYYNPTLFKTYSDVCYQHSATFKSFSVVFVITSLQSSERLVLYLSLFVH